MKSLALDGGDRKKGGDGKKGGDAKEES